MSETPHHALEPEFAAPPPRPIPDELRRGPYARRRRTAIAASATSGVACLLLAQAPQVARLALYLLPLAYLDWIGAGLLAFAALGAADRVLRLGPYRWVRDGIPIPARIAVILKTVEAEYNGSPVSHRFVVAAQLEHPETGETLMVQLASDGFPSSDRDAYDTPFRSGDLATAVYLPGEFERSLRLYPFLQLNPAHALRRAGSLGPAAARAKTAATVAAVTAPFVGGLYGLGYSPIDLGLGPATLAAGAGSLAVGTLYVGGIFWGHRRMLREVGRRNLAAFESGAPIEESLPVGGSGRLGTLLKVLLVAGAPLIGGVLVFSFSFLANAWLDASPPRLEPIRIEGRSVETWGFVLRQYTLDYALEARPSEKRHFEMAPEELAAFAGERGVARVRDGAFGWPWVEAVSPAGDPR